MVGRQTDRQRGIRERERERERQIDRETDRKKDRQIDRQIDREREREREGERERGDASATHCIFCSRARHRPLHDGPYDMKDGKGIYFLHLFPQFILHINYTMMYQMIMSV